MNNPTQPQLQTIALDNGEVVQARSVVALSFGACTGCIFKVIGDDGVFRCKYSITECTADYNQYNRIFIEGSDEALAKYITAKHFSGISHG